MIRSRVFLALSVFLIFSGLIVYLFIDLRDKEDRAYEFFQETQFEKVLDLYSAREIVESELSASLLSQSVSALEKKANETKSQEEVLGYLGKKHPELSIEEWETSLGKYYHIQDPFFSLLKIHSIHYKKALIAKIASIQKAIPKDKVSHFLLQLILEDPRGLEESYSIALANLLRMPMDSIGELESGFLGETLSYLSGSSLSLFYENYFTVNGTNVNLRSGPGKENKEVGKVSSPDMAYCFEKDSDEITVSGKPGVFIRCYYPHLSKSAWIFSGFLEKSSPNLKLVSDFEKRYQSKQSEEKLDFVNWTGDKIPPGFYGTYLPRERKIEGGDIGFPLFGNKTKEYRTICKKMEGEKSFFEFSYVSTDAKVPIPLLNVQLVYDRESHLVYSLESDKESIIINKNRYILEQPTRKQTLMLSIDSKTSGAFLASLKERNKGLLQNIKSEPIDLGYYTPGKYSWEVCLPLAKSPTRDNVILFDIISGTN